jgi:hypothetical protein
LAIPTNAAIAVATPVIVRAPDGTSRMYTPGYVSCTISAPFHSCCSAVEASVQRELIDTRPGHPGSTEKLGSHREGLPSERACQIKCFRIGQSIDSIDWVFVKRKARLDFVIDDRCRALRSPPRKSPKGQLYSPFSFDTKDSVVYFKTSIHETHRLLIMSLAQ